ncbi:MAG: hypothetical protein HRT65_06175 [Flavobacteriaceae bacterium]|nr:hypothetical protein [Flavobacteriaceae bacterium]
MKTYLTYLEEFKRNEKGYSSIFIIIQSCLGSIAAMFILMQGTSISQLFQLFLVTITCMVFNASILSQQKPKLIFELFFIGLLVNTVLLLLNSL